MLSALCQQWSMLTPVTAALQLHNSECASTQTVGFIVEPPMIQVTGFPLSRAELKEKVGLERTMLLQTRSWAE